MVVCLFTPFHFADQKYKCSIIYYLHWVFPSITTIYIDNMDGQSLFLPGPFGSIPKKPVGLFWDIENCSIPQNLNVLVLINKIRDIFNQFKMIEREFAIACDVHKMSKSVVDSLNKQNVNIVHVSSFSKNSCDEKLKQMVLKFVRDIGSNSAIVLLSSNCIILFLTF